MFQNITGEFEEKEITKNNIKPILAELFKFQNIIIYILTLLLSTISIKQNICPFGIAMLAATLGSGTPVIGVFISGIVGTAIGTGLNAVLEYIAISILYFIFVLLFKSQMALEERNEQLKTGGKLFWASLIINVIKNMSGIFLMYDVFMSVITAALIYVFYKIFVNGLVVIKNIALKNAYSIEELIGATIIISIANLAFNNLNIYGLNIANIIVMLMIMVLGWKNGMILGGTAGISIGLAMSITGEITILQITMFAVSGIIAGILNKFGKIGVILGFVIGNIGVTYITKGSVISVIYLREMFIASIGLLLVPSNLKIEIDDLVGKVKLLDNVGERRLEDNLKVAEKLKTLSKTINEIVRENIEVVPENFIEEFLDEMEEIPDNIFFEEITDEENGIIREIGIEIQKKEVLVEKDLIEILKNHNNYVYMQDEEIKNDLQEVLKKINRSYKVFQIEKIKKEERNKEMKNVSCSLKEISKVIEDCADKIEEKQENTEFIKKEKEIVILLNNKNYNIKKCRISLLKNNKYIVEIKTSLNTTIRDKDIVVNIGDIISKSLSQKIVFQRDKKIENENEYVQIYSSEDKYVLQVGSAKISKENSEASGDCSLQMRLDDGKYILAISDGKGSGITARESSKRTITKLKELFSSGFEKEEAMRLINTSLNLENPEDMYSSLDLSILDLYQGKIDIIKNGSCNTYIKNKKNIKIIESNELPMGITHNVDFKTNTIDVTDGDIILMCSDGVLESKDDLNKDWIEQFLKNISTNNAQKMADLILAEAIDNSYGIAHDDITVIVAKVVKKK